MRFLGFYRRSRCPQACYNLKSCSQRYLERTLMFKCDPHFSCCAMLLNAQVRYSFCYIETNYNIAVHITLYISTEFGGYLNSQLQEHQWRLNKGTACKLTNIANCTDSINYYMYFYGCCFIIHCTVSVIRYIFMFTHIHLSVYLLLYTSASIKIKKKYKTLNSFVVVV